MTTPVTRARAEPQTPPSNVCESAGGSGSSNLQEVVDRLRTIETKLDLILTKLFLL
jgi:hypothetical protein